MQPDQRPRVSSKGWVVRATTNRCGHLCVQILDIAIPDAADALQAARKVCGADADIIVEIETIAELPSGTDLRNGEVLLR